MADFDSHVELRAKDFALAMTDHNIKDKDITGKPKLQEEVVNNSKATRQALLKRGIKPELLNAQEDIKKSRIDVLKKINKSAMYKAPFYLTGNRGNNAFSYELRKDPKLYIPSLVSGTLDDAELGDEVVFEDFDDGILKSCTGLKTYSNSNFTGVPQS